MNKKVQTCFFEDKYDHFCAYNLKKLVDRHIIITHIFDTEKGANFNKRDKLLKFKR